MISKKDAVTLGMLAIGGVGAAMIVSGDGGGDGGGGGGAAMKGVRGRAGGILGTQQGYGQAPVVYNLPAATEVTFPKAPAFDISKFFAPQEVSRGTAGVSAAPKKYRSAGTALGYSGYVTPVTPTPVSPGYVPGVTTFKPYAETKYIPSPVKPPSTSYGGGVSKKTSTPGPVQKHRAGVSGTRVSKWRK